ncbi:MAG: hypothetical protein ACPGWR_18830 [Ardenticatenaceae bacterium]
MAAGGRTRIVAARNKQGCVFYLSPPEQATMRVLPPREQAQMRVLPKPPRIIEQIPFLLVQPHA